MRYTAIVTVMSPTTVLLYRRRADSFLRAAGDLATLESDVYAPAIGLLSVHSCIALADAVLVAVEGRRSKAEDHAEAARRLRGWCSAKRLADSGVKHFEWLLGQKNHFSYNDDLVKDEDLFFAKVKMEQFFAWAFQTFPGVAQITESTHA